MKEDYFVVISADDARCIAGGLAVSDKEYARLIGYLIGFLVGTFSRGKSMVKK